MRKPQRDKGHKEQKKSLSMRMEHKDFWLMCNKRAKKMRLSRFAVRKVSDFPEAIKNKKAMPFRGVASLRLGKLYGKSQTFRTAKRHSRIFFMALFSSLSYYT